MPRPLDPTSSTGLRLQAFIVAAVAIVTVSTAFAVTFGGAVLP